MDGNHRNVLSSFIYMLMIVWTCNQPFGVCGATAMHTHSGLIKQHRVKASKRKIDYGMNHPWNTATSTATATATDLNTHNKHVNRQQSRRGVTNINRSTSSSEQHRETQSISDNNNDENVVGWSIQSDIKINDESTIYQPIRIRASLVNHESSGYHLLSLSERRAILSMIKPSLNNWSRALSVPRIRGNLTIDRNQLYDGISCGPGIDSGEPSVVIPKEHYTNGETDVDLIVYVSLSFQEDVLKKLKNHASKDDNEESEAIPPTNAPSLISTMKSAEVQSSGDYFNYTGPSEFFQPENTPSQNSTTTSNSTIAPSETPTLRSRHCTGSYLASATYCSTDQYDRPVAGLLHLCIGENFFQQSSLDLNHLTILHELGHILGFNSHALAYFRDKDTGDPLTERIDGDVPDVEVECTGVKLGRSNATIPLPSEKILKFREVRGIRVSEIVTPTVQQIVRNRFNCDNLNGAELESEIFHPVNETTRSCVGDHWERRLFKYDIMNPIVDLSMPSSLFSPLTLAYFVDSGWYKVDSSRAFSSNTWGRGAGCDFVNSPCLSKGGKVPKINSKFFCSYRDKDDYDGCSDDMKSKAICSTTAFDSSLPTEFQYFSEENLGGFDMNLDYCPTFLGTSDGICSNKEDSVKKKSRLDSFGFSNSRCLSGKSDGNDEPLCVQVACAAKSKSLHIKVDGFWKQCHYSGEVIESWWDKDYVVCPDPLLLCPTFYCPRDCLHDQSASKCNFNNGTCACIETNVTQCGKKNVDLSEHELLKEFYVSDSTVLTDDEKNVFDHAARMFIQMSVGEVISFVACSLLVVISCTIVMIYAVKLIRQRADLFNMLPRWFPRSYAWRADLNQWAFSHSEEEGESGNKDKMVASVLHNLRIDNTAMGIVSELHEEEDCPDEINHWGIPSLTTAALNSNNDEVTPENVLQPPTILRSQLPPLPSAGRILSIPGFTYIDDSMLINNEDDLLTAAEATAIGSRTSCRSSQLESCSIQSVLDESEALDISTVRRRK